MKKAIVLFMLIGIVFGFSGGMAFADKPPCSVTAQITPANTILPETDANGVRTVIQLNATGGSKNNATSFVWEQTGGLSATFSHYDYDNQTNLPVKAYFTSPDVGPSGATLTFRLTVYGCSPEQHISSSTDVNITYVASNRAPVASATVSPYPYALEGEQVTLDGSASSDPDGDPLTYNWYQVINGIEYSMSSNAVWSFIAPNDAYPNGEALTFRLRVSDGYLSSSTDKIVNITWVNDPPDAIIECPQPVDERSQVILDGSKSTDSDNGIASYSWNQVLGEPNADLSQVDLFGPSITSITFSAPTLTSSLNIMKFGLTVTDGNGLQDFAGCDIKVLDITPPDWSCTPSGPDGSWHATDVTLNCTASDAGSGLANPSDSSFTLVASISDGYESDNVQTDKQDLCDARSDGSPNCTTAGPITGFKIDKKAPQFVSCDVPDGIWHAGNVTLGCVYSDSGSGPVAQTVQLNTSVGDGTETGNASASAGGSKACDAVNNCAASPSDISGNKIDMKPPQLSSCQSPDGLWYANDVTLNCSYTDGGSGPASQDVSLSTNVTAGTETNNAAASANGKQACDAVKNCASSPADISGNKIDKKGPTNISFVGGVADGGPYYFGFLPVDPPTCSATDGGSGFKSCVVSGYDPKAIVGSHTLTAAAKDNVGNQSSSTMTYIVTSWTLKGFYQPVDMNGVFNTVKGGSTVPLKFEIFAGPTELTDIAYIKSLTYVQTNCSDTAITDEIETTATGGTILRYDGDQFIYNWKTPTGAGKCYRTTMTGQDGSTISAFFKMK